MRKRIAVLTAVAALVAISLSWADSAFSWSPSALGPRAHRRAPALEPGEIRAVTFNAWKLSQPARVPGLVDALRDTARRLAAHERDLPELVAVQEIESRAAARALIEALPDHEVTICECAHEGDRLRSAVAIAADRRVFSQRGSECIALDRVWPDHPRCAVAVELEYPARQAAPLPRAGSTRAPLRSSLEHEGRTLHAIGVHLAWHLDNHAMAERLRRAIDDRMDEPAILLGDMNTWPGTEAHAILTAAPLFDACEASGPTHFTGSRLDYVLPNAHVRFVRGLDRRASFDALGPSSSVMLPDVCDAGRSPECPVSDHLPEGAVLRLTD